LRNQCKNHGGKWCKMVENQDRTMWKLASSGFQKCGSFWELKLFNGGYCCSKSTDFEILDPSPKKRHQRCR
jgi:hypothetical protein